jgi:DNA primase
MPAFDPSVIDVEDFLEALEIRNARQATAEEIRFSCPFPNHSNGDENASAYMNIETTNWYCHGCHEKGNAVSFAADYLGISPIEATRMLREVYQPGFINPEARNTSDEVRRIFDKNREEHDEPEQPQLDESVLERFGTDWFAVEKAVNNGDETYGLDYMLGRGFGPEVLTDWEIGYDESSRRITIPVRDLEGTLIGFKARAIDDRHPKYLVLGDRPGKRERYGWPCYHTSRVVFGLDRAVRMEDEPRHLVVCEGELNAIALQVAGFPGVAINGSQFSLTQANLLRQEADAVTIFFDYFKRNDEGELVPDVAGRDGAVAVMDALKPFMVVRVVHGHEGDPASMSVAEIRETVEKAEGATRFAIMHG